MYRAEADMGRGEVSVADRATLVRLCAHLTGDPHAAEDLAQEALLIGWQREHELRDPGKRAQWLAGIGAARADALGRRPNASRPE